MGAVPGGQGGRAVVDLGGLAGEELLGERLGVVVAVGQRLGCLAGARLEQHVRGQQDGVPVLVPGRLPALKHGDQQGGARRLQPEDEPDGAVGGRAGRGGGAGGRSSSGPSGRGWRPSSCRISAVTSRNLPAASAAAPGPDAAGTSSATWTSARAVT